jgi:NADH-quinone oxidoreductase subunit I
MSDKPEISIQPQAEVETKGREPQFTNTLSTGFKLFALFAVAWFLFIFAILKSFQLLEDTSTFDIGGKAFLAFIAGVPLVLIAIVLVRFYWWLSLYIRHVTIWGRDLEWTKYLWFISLIAVTVAYIDPLDNIGRTIARAVPISQLAQFGIPSFNPVMVLYRLIVLLLLLLLCFSYLRMAAEIVWHWTKNAWEMAVSFPQGLVISAMNFLRPNICVEYPEYRDEISENFRGRHMLASDERGRHLCIACRNCERVCPDRLILISAVRNPENKKLELTGFLLDNSRCCFCGLCEDSCPTNAVKHTVKYEYSCYNRSELILDLFDEYMKRTEEERHKHGGASDDS